MFFIFSSSDQKMAQKIMPRSLRSEKILFPDSSFFSDFHYSKIWSLGYTRMNRLIQWSQQNGLYKNKSKTKSQKRSVKKQKLPSFLKIRTSFLSKTGNFQMSPILLKFAYQSFAKKYNPIKAFQKKNVLREPLLKKSIKK